MINPSESPSHRITKDIPVSFVEFNYKTIRARAFTKSREERVEKISLSLKDLVSRFASMIPRPQPSIPCQLGGIEEEIELSFDSE